MPAYTSRLALEYPLSSDTDNVPGNLQTLAEQIDDIAVPYQAVSTLPEAGNAGFLYLLTTTSVLYLDTGSEMLALNEAAGTVTVTIPHTWAVTGTLAVTSGATDFLPPLVAPVSDAQSIELLGAWTSCRSGSCAVSILAGGTAVDGLGDIMVSTSTTYSAAASPLALTNGEPVEPSITGITDDPDGLSVTLLLAYTLSVS